MKIFFAACLWLAGAGLHVVYAATVPLDLESGQWQSLEYRNIPANRVVQLEDRLQINIRRSASPLIYLFGQPRLIKQISVSGRMNGLPIIPLGKKQGEAGADDFPLRIGLVLEGDKQLNFAQRLIAARWVKTLFNLAPPGTGIDHISFLNLANPGAVDWKTRKHPSGEGLYTETIVDQVKPDEAFNLNYTLPDTQSVLALWISSDGDDTGSNYSLTIDRIDYN